MSTRTTISASAMLSCRVLEKDPPEARCPHFVSHDEARPARGAFHSPINLWRASGAAVSWYAVGCYYHMIGDFENARRYFSKSTTIDHRRPGWGASTCFRRAGRVRPGHGRVPNRRRPSRVAHSAESAWSTYALPASRAAVHPQAQEISFTSPWCFTSLALHITTASTMMRYPTPTLPPTATSTTRAREPSTSTQATRIARSAISTTRHCGTVLSCHQPGLASTYSALGFTLHLKGDLDGAIELYHQSLSLKPDDTFTCEMLTEALRDTLDVTDLGGGPSGGSTIAMEVM